MPNTIAAVPGPDEKPSSLWQEIEEPPIEIDEFDELFR
jgi:hypothetical protein